MRLSLQHFTPAVFWLLLILFFSVIPGRELPDTGPKGLDKIVHVGFYAILYFLLKIAFLKQLIFSSKRYKTMYYALGIAFSYGVLMELIQHFLCAGRSFEFFDVLANGIGCLVGIIIFKLIYYKI